MLIRIFIYLDIWTLDNSYCFLWTNATVFKACLLRMPWLLCGLEYNIHQAYRWLSSIIEGIVGGTDPVWTNISRAIFLIRFQSTCMIHTHPLTAGSCRARWSMMSTASPVASSHSLIMTMLILINVLTITIIILLHLRDLKICGSHLFERGQ